MAIEMEKLKRPPTPEVTGVIAFWGRRKFTNKQELLSYMRGESERHRGVREHTRQDCRVAGAQTAADGWMRLHKRLSPMTAPALKKMLAEPWDLKALMAAYQDEHWVPTKDVKFPGGRPPGMRKKPVAAKAGPKDIPDDDEDDIEDDIPDEDEGEGDE